MNPRLRLLVALLMLAVGLAAAYAFRKPQNGTPENPPAVADAPLRWRRPAEPPWSGPVAEEPSWLVVRRRPAPKAEAAPDRETAWDFATRPEVRGDDAVPTLAPNYPRWGAEAIPAESWNPPRPEPGADWSAEAASDPPPRPAPRNHTVVDGDTLYSLAERYLGDRHRYRDIYELNLHLLSDPDVLPIGASLLIPPRETQLASQAGSPPPGMVPVPRGTHPHDPATQP